MLTAFAPFLLLGAVLCAMGVAVAIPLVLLSSPEAFARASVRRSVLIPLELVVELMAWSALLGVLVSGACWFISSRQWAVAGRYACPLFPILAGMKCWVEWRRGVYGAVDPADVLYGELLVLFCTTGAFVGGYLGDRRRRRAAAPPVVDNPKDVRDAPR